MSDVTPDKVELSATQNRNWALIGIVVFLVTLLQGFFTYNITSASTEMRETNRNLVEVTATVRVTQAQMGYQQKQIDDLQASKKDANAIHKVHDDRLGSIEQRLALHDQWIQAHNH